MKITKQNCEQYADRRLDEVSEDVLKHLGWKFLNLEPIEKEMGGFANFRNYFCNQLYLRQIEELQEENKQFRKLLRDEDGVKSALQLIGENDQLKEELKFVYSQIRKHDRTGILKGLFKGRL